MRQGRVYAMGICLLHPLFLGTQHTHGSAHTAGSKGMRKFPSVPSNYALWQPHLTSSLVSTLVIAGIGSGVPKCRRTYSTCWQAGRVQGLCAKGTILSLISLSCLPRSNTTSFGRIIKQAAAIKWMNRSVFPPTGNFPQLQPFTFQLLYLMTTLSL